MNEITKHQGTELTDVFADEPFEDLGEGIRSALASLSINQNIFRIRHHKTYENLPAEQSRRIEIVIVKSAKAQSKAYWPGGFGGDTPPTCWSSNSLTPDAQVPSDQVQSKTCGVCPNNVFITAPNGMKQKACGDHKRLALVPAGDLRNEAYGGCMIFRVPAGSLGNLDKYANELKTFKINYFTQTTFIELTIDPQKNVTKLLFEGGRPLTLEEKIIIKELREDEKSGRIINEEILGYEEGATPPQPSEPPKAAAPIPQRHPSTSSGPVAPQPAKVIPHTPAVQQPIPQPTARPAQPTTINAAVAKPATPPPSQRTVITSPPEEESPGEMPDEMNELFGDLMNR